MTNAAIKSLTPVRLTGGGNNGGWAARARFQDGSELFMGHGASYTMHQAQAAIDNTKGNFSDYATLPSGVKVSA